MDKDSSMSPLKNFKDTRRLNNNGALKTKILKAPRGFCLLYLDREKQGNDKLITGYKLNNLSRRIVLQLDL